MFVLLSLDVNRGIILFSLLCETMRLEVSIEITFVDKYDDSYLSQCKTYEQVTPRKKKEKKEKKKAEGTESPGPIAEG